MYTHPFLLRLSDGFEPLPKMFVLSVDLDIKKMFTSSHRMEGGSENQHTSQILPESDNKKETRFEIT